VSFNPERYGHVLRWADEGYLIFNAILQQYYLKKYCKYFVNDNIWLKGFYPKRNFIKQLFLAASFSETFYGLKRVSVIDSKLKGKLSHKQQILSLILIVTLPYLKNKLAKLSLKYRLEEADSHESREVSLTSVMRIF